MEQVGGHLLLAIPFSLSFPFFFFSSLSSPPFGLHSDAAEKCGPANRQGYLRINHPPEALSRPSLDALGPGGQSWPL